MKIVFVKKRYSPYGGAERYLHTLLHELIKDRHEIHVVSTSWPRVDGVIFHKVNLKEINSFLSITLFNRKVSDILKRISPDCVVSFERTTNQHIYRAGDGCHREWLKLRKRIEGFLKSLSFSFNPLHRKILSIEREIFERTPLIIANSKMVKDQIIKHYSIKEEKIQVIYNGVDLDRYSPDNRAVWRDKVRADLSIGRDDRLLIFVGSDFKRKGLVQIMNALVKLDYNIKLLVVGKGNIEKYSKISKRLGVSDRVIFIGPQKNVERLYAASDIFVLPTLYDPFSNATLEAMASGLPVITTNTNGASEIIDNAREGFIINLFNIDSMVDAINNTIKAIVDMADAARKKAELFPIEKARKDFIGTIFKVVKIDA